MPKGIYKRIKPVWNKNTGIRYNEEVLARAKQLFYNYLSTLECNKILTKEFGTKVRANVFWEKIFSEEERKKHRTILCSQSKMGDKNPMKKDSAKLKSSSSHRNQISWCRGLKGEEFKKHFKGGKIGGSRPKGYKHTTESRILMSKNTKGKKHKVIFSEQRKNQYANRMKINRKNFEFNTKMFKSFTRAITKPHKQVLEWIKEYTHLNTTSNYCIKVGRVFGSIDEADPERRVGVYVDGNYWHNYPNGRRWDKCCDTFLRNQNWVVLRIWESDITNNPSEIINKLKEIDNGKKYYQQKP